MKKDEIRFPVDQTALVKKIIKKRIQGPLGGAITGALLVCTDLIDGNEIIAQHNAHAVMLKLKEWLEE